jgi:hypothetical protein
MVGTAFDTVQVPSTKYKDCSYDICIYRRNSLCTVLRIEGLEGGTWKEQYPAEWFPG